MPLNLLDHCEFNGPALPEPFVRFELEKELGRLDLLPKTTGDEGKKLQLSWDVYRRKLRELDIRGGPLRVRHCVLDPLVERLGFARSDSAPEVETREGREDGGYVLTSADGSTRLRTWTTEFDEDLDAPARRGAAYRFSHLRIAQRVLLAAGERIGLLTNGVQLRVLISDPARPDSEVVIRIQSAWKPYRDAPDSYRFLLALCQPKGVVAVPDLVEKARLQQARVTKDLRLQARRAVEHFVQEVLDHPANSAVLSQYEDREKLAKSLWHEGLVLVYRLLFILKLESTDDPARSFSFASSSLWRNTFSPGVALAVHVRDVLDRGEETGRFLEDALRRLFEMFSKGLECSELHIKPLGGALFGPEAAPLLDNPALTWGERAVAFLLDQLLWTQPKRGGVTRQRVHYGALDVEDLGRVYEALLELEAGIATERLCRLRRQKLEVVVPAEQGEKYCSLTAPVVVDDAEEDAGEAAADESEEENPASGKKTKIEWIEEIPPHQFFLRVGLGRKATGSYYTPHSFVRFLVQETLGPPCAARSPQNDPNPCEILKLKVLDPAMGSGHFLVEACRFLAEKLYEACRLCDERADPAERRAENAIDEKVKAEAIAEAAKWRGRVLALPDPNDEIVQYLPSRAPEGIESGISQRRALALCRRLVAVHSLYGVDKNRLAVELAKLSLWIESHSEGLPLTFLDHRLVEGDSVTGPLFEHLLTYPNSREPLEGLFADGLRAKLTNALAEALRHVTDIESSVGTTLSETELKKVAKENLDCALKPFRMIAAAWAGRVMSGKEASVDYAHIVHQALSGTPVDDALAEWQALAYDLVFPEVFFPSGKLDERSGFDVIVGNPPWNQEEVGEPEFWSALDPEMLNYPSSERTTAIERLREQSSEYADMWGTYQGETLARLRAYSVLFDKLTAPIDGTPTSGKPDLFQLFTFRSLGILATNGHFGMVLPSGFHNNEGAGQLRRLILDSMSLKYCFGFENRRRLFEIDIRQKYACVGISRSGQPTGQFKVAFYLQDDDWLFDQHDPDPLTFSPDFVASIGGPLRVFVEARSQTQIDLLLVCAKNADPWNRSVSERGIYLSQGMSSTRDAAKRVAIETVRQVGPLSYQYRSEPALIVLEGKNVWQYSDKFDSKPREAVLLSRLSARSHWLRSARYFRLAQRRIASSTNERTAVFCIVPPGTASLETLRVETTPWARPSVDVLTLLGVLNSFAFDFCSRPLVASTVSEYLVDLIPVSRISREPNAFLAHSALRLVCNGPDFVYLWAEQLQGAWREGAPPNTWPVLASEASRWEVYSAIDAFVAASYGLTHRQYEQVLTTFSHKAYRDAPAVCIGKYEELEVIGETAFIQKYDPYWDIPVNRALPTAVVELPGSAGSGAEHGDFSLSSPVAAPKRGRRR